MIAALSFALGLVIGGGIAFLSLKARRARPAQERATLTERLAAREEALGTLRGDLQTAQAQFQSLQSDFGELRVREGELRVQLSGVQQSAAEKEALLANARESLTNVFKAIAAETLQGQIQVQRDEFLSLAKLQLQQINESAKVDLDKRQTAIDGLVKPVHESLTRVSTRIEELEQLRRETDGRINEQLIGLRQTHTLLQQETGNLVRALKNPAVRGRWGEMQLRRVVELAGMLEHCDFVEQASVQTDDGRRRPDMVINLPGGRTVVIDAKVALSAYLEAAQATDETVRRDKLVQHAQQIRRHVSELGRRNYFEHFERSPEFVVLFVPGEAFYFAALQLDPELIQAGIEQNVLLATPTTLLAMLRAISFGWREECIAENARQISELGRDLHQRLSRFLEHMASVGDGLTSVVSRFNNAVGSLEQRVLPSARRFKELGAAGASEELPLLSPIGASVRRSAAPELLRRIGPADEAVA